MEILQFVWDPTSEGITIFGKFTIYYYSLMWMLAFILGFYIMQIIYKKEGLSMEKLDSLFVYTILGTMIGARLGHVIFYQIELFDQDFFSVFLPFRFNPTFEFTGFRGLASHGAAIGIITAMYLYNSRILKKSDHELKLTEREIDTIIFLKNENKPVKVDVLQKKVWKYAEDLETHTVETHIYRLRKKIKDTFNDDTFIQSKKDGYIINE